MKALEGSSVAFRLSTAAMFGRGHISRCFAIRIHLPFPVKWFIDPSSDASLVNIFPSDDEVIVEDETDGSARCVEWLKGENDSLVILDNYNVEPHGLLAAAKTVFAFSDERTLPTAKNLIIIDPNPNVERNTDGFNGKHLLGPSYLAFNTFGKRQSPKNFSNIVRPVKVLIGFGSRDSKNHTGMVLSALLADKELKNQLLPICMIGPDCKFVERIRRQLKLFRKSLLLSDCQSVLDVPVDCTLAIGSPGVSQAERLFSGLATVLIPQNKTHELLCESWHYANCAFFAKAEAKQIASGVHEMISNNFEKARSISYRGQSLVDGLGAYRIAQKIIAGQKNK